MRNMLYRVEEFGALESPSGHGGWGLNTYLDHKFTQKLRETPIESHPRNVMQEDAKDIIKRFCLDKTEIEHPYVFYEGSWLISGIKVPGNSADLSLDESSKMTLGEGHAIGQARYMSHNVDSMSQAACLASLFFHWANTADACL